MCWARMSFFGRSGLDLQACLDKGTTSANLLGQLVARVWLTVWLDCPKFCLGIFLLNQHVTAERSETGSFLRQSLVLLKIYDLLSSLGNGMHEKLHSHSKKFYCGDKMKHDDRRIPPRLGGLHTLLRAGVLRLLLMCRQFPEEAVLSTSQV